MINPQEIYKWYDIFHGSAETSLAELRLLGRGGNKDLSGYFSSVEGIVQALAPYQNSNYGIYSPININYYIIKLFIIYFYL